MSGETIVLEDVRTEDGGYYYCKVKNKEDNILAASILLQVRRNLKGLKAKVRDRGFDLSLNKLAQAIFLRFRIVHATINQINTSWNSLR